MEIHELILLSGLAAGLLGGILASKTSFCTLGAVSDLVNIGDSGRMRAWVLALASAMLGVAVLDAMGSIDPTLVDSGMTGKPPYGTPVFLWPRYVLGGLLFGAGMVLVSGCGNKTLVRIGGGNLKSVVVFLVMGVAAYLMIFTNFGFLFFLQWMQPATIDLQQYGVSSQSLSVLAGEMLGFGGEEKRWILGLLVGIPLFSWLLLSLVRRSDVSNIAGGIGMGLLVTSAWYATAGPMGRHLLEEIDFLDVRPFDVGAQSFTFVKPGAHFLRFLEEGFAAEFLTFALAITLGVVLGSFFYALFSRSFRVEWFVSFRDFLRHIIGATAMGVGGVLSLGCTFGQAISGASMLAVGSFITFASIVFASAMVMKFQYYQLCYEAEAKPLKIFATALVDFRLLPEKFRYYEKI